MFRGTLPYEFYQLLGYWKKTISYTKTSFQQSEKLSFGKHSNQYLKLYSPSTPDPAKPLLIYYHGGGWIFGKPEVFIKKASLFTSLGYQVVMPCYRKVPRFHADDIIEDAKLMLKKVIELSNEGVIHNIKKIILGGVSAGANLTALIYFRKEIHEWAGITQDQFIAMFMYAPPLDLEKMRKTPVLYRYAGARDSKRFYNTSPINFIQDSHPIPILCTHGKKDALVQFAASQTFRNQYRKLYPDLLSYHELESGTHLDAASWAHTDNEMRKQLVSWLKSVS